MQKIGLRGFRPSITKFTFISRVFLKSLFFEMCEQNLHRKMKYQIDQVEVRSSSRERKTHIWLEPLA